MKLFAYLSLVVILVSCSKTERLESVEPKAPLNPFQAYAGSYQGSGQQTLTYMSKDSLGNWYTKHEVSNLHFSAAAFDSVYNNALQYHFNLDSNWLYLTTCIQDSVVLDSNLFYEGEFEGNLYSGLITIRHSPDSLWLSFYSGNSATACRIELGALKQP